MTEGRAKRLMHPLIVALSWTVVILGSNQRIVLK
jgi:hypothetical protein